DLDERGFVRALPVQIEVYVPVGPGTVVTERGADLGRGPPLARPLDELQRAGRVPVAIGLAGARGGQEPEHGGQSDRRPLHPAPSRATGDSIRMVHAPSGRTRRKPVPPPGDRLGDDVRYPRRCTT